MKTKTELKVNDTLDNQKHLYVVVIETKDRTYHKYFTTKEEAKVFMKVSKIQYPDAIIESDF
jgi:hypothetical protein